MESEILKDRDAGLRGGRAQLSSLLKEMLRDGGGTLPFGPGQPGLLVLLHNNDDEDKNGGLDRDEVSRGSVQALLGQLRNNPFVTLTFAEGTKYTFGNLYVSRESQGEFVFFDLLVKDNAAKPLKEENYFTLECEWVEDGECFWISVDSIEGLSASTQVYVNGAVLLTGDGGDQPGPNDNRRYLVFGDVVTISLCAGEGARLLFDYIFKPPGSISFGPSGVFANPLIVEMILQFLPTTKVQCLRTLSHVWNREGLKGLRNRVRVTPFSLKALTGTADELSQVTSYAQSQMSDLDFPFWKIEIGRRHEVSEASGVQLRWKSIKEKKLLDDLGWFFRQRQFSVKSLHLSGEIVSETSLALFETLLCGLKDTLTDLDLKIHSLSEFSPSTPLGFELPWLKSLSLTYITDDDANGFSPIPGLQPFLVRLLPAAGCIECFKVDGPEINPLEHNWILMCQLVLDEMARIRAEDPRKFSYLTDVAIGCCWDNQRVLAGLASLRAECLKKLDLRSAPTNLNDLLPTLQAHAGSLETLIIHFDADNSTDINLSFPERLPKLQNLSILLHLEIGCRPFNLAFGHGAQHADDPVNYRKRFPCLSKLTVRPTNTPCSIKDDFETDRTTWYYFHPTLEAFIRPCTDDEGNIIPVTSVQSLDIPFQLRGEYHYMLDDLEATFPNVVFPPELAKAREGPVWEEGETEEESDEMEGDGDVEEDEDQ